MRDRQVSDCKGDLGHLDVICKFRTILGSVVISVVSVINLSVVIASVGPLSCMRIE